MATKENTKTVKIGGESFDRDTLAEAIQDVRTGRMPVGIMDEGSLHDALQSRLLWIVAGLNAITAQGEDATITDAADAALLHAEQARDIWAALTEE